MEKYHVPALERTIKILKLISESKDTYTGTEICKMLDLPKATVFAIMKTLEYHNMVQKDLNGRFQIGPKMFQIGMTYVSDSNMIELAKPYMKRLMGESGFTVHLGILHENQIMYIAKEEPDSFIKFSTYPGLKTEIHLTGLGKAIAAYLSESELDQIVTFENLDKATPNTITDMTTFKESLRAVRQNGYAIEDEEGEIGVRCIAAPIINARHTTPTAISVTGHTSQLPKDRFSKIGELVRETAQDIAKSI
ncbi:MULTISPECIES: IclR family transcriptional regulator [Oceanobacillus]|uniref:HTH-type transcriptional repressor AllR n=2 Tax=Oceanobacillus TaxID=182709 RepID=A0A0A1MJR2_9BACI|nr:IclR family transcriptional regulator [Oceanobacillus oncorhynchi]MDM8099733.1 IclR family transcriptional regulator [Oceanobacillus oncorhynchi]CEI83313.1 HTH-type transcriptional repressor AllR [Oceanobacillus oncorhynchi]